MRTAFGILLYSIAGLLSIYILKNVRQNKLGIGDAIALLGIVVSAIAAINIFPVPSSNIVDHLVVGNWRFVRFEHGSPDFPGAINVKFESIRFHKDGTYNVRLVVSLQRGGSFSQDLSGKYTLMDTDMVKLEQQTSQQATTQMLNFSVSVDKLKLSDPTAYTAVFQRIP